jgi:nicotinamide-nucleotide amidase
MLTEAHVLIIGSEMLEGRRRDINLFFLAPRLLRLGIPVQGMRIIPDIPGALPAALRELGAPGRLLITTGGLGPTRDDLTRREVAEAFALPIAHSQHALEHLEKWAARVGRTLTESGLIQTEIPEGAETLDNPRGTALGVWLEVDDCVIVSLPGVPSEVEAIWNAGLALRLAQGGEVPQTIAFFTNGLGEGVQEERMRGMEWPEGVDFCSLPGPWGVEIQLSCRLTDPVEASLRVERARELLLPRLAPYVVEPLGLNPAEAMVAILKERGETVSLAESCTAGLTAGALGSIPGVSSVLHGSLVAYSNDVKTRFLDVPPAVISEHGAVSQATVDAMSQGTCKMFQSELGLSVSGIAGPGGGTDEKPVGTVWISATYRNATRSELLRLSGSRDEIRLRSAWRLIALGLRCLNDAQ